jgi:hypothetical protein
MLGVCRGIRFNKDRIVCGVIVVKIFSTRADDPNQPTTLLKIDVDGHGKAIREGFLKGLSNSDSTFAEAVGQEEFPTGYVSSSLSAIGLGERCHLPWPCNMKAKAWDARDSIKAPALAEQTNKLPENCKLKYLIPTAIEPNSASSCWSGYQGHGVKQQRHKHKHNGGAAVVVHHKKKGKGGKVKVSAADPDPLKIEILDSDEELSLIITRAAKCQEPVNPIAEIETAVEHMKSVLASALV